MWYLMSWHHLLLLLIFWTGDQFSYMCLLHSTMSSSNFIGYPTWVKSSFTTLSDTHWATLWTSDNEPILLDPIEPNNTFAVLKETCEECQEFQMNFLNSPLSPFLPVIITKLSFKGSSYLAQYPLPNNSLCSYWAFTVLKGWSCNDFSLITSF